MRIVEVEQGWIVEGSSNTQIYSSSMAAALWMDAELRRQQGAANPVDGEEDQECLAGSIERQRG